MQTSTLLVLAVLMAVAPVPGVEGQRYSEVYLAQPFDGMHTIPCGWQVFCALGSSCEMPKIGVCAVHARHASVLADEQRKSQVAERDGDIAKSPSFAKSPSVSRKASVLGNCGGCGGRPPVWCGEEYTCIGCRCVKGKKDIQPLPDH